MSFTKLAYTRDWTNPSDFLTVQTTEAAVRSDMQDLFNQAKSGLNTVIDQLEGESGAENIGISEIEGITADNIQGALEAIVSSSKDIFVATYNSTTFSDVKDAYTNGKTIIAKYVGSSSNLYYELDEAWTSAFQGSFYFTRIKAIHSLGDTVNVSSIMLESTGWSEVSTTTVQEALVSGTNIKTINNQSILGSGNIITTGSGDMLTANYDPTTSGVTNPVLTAGGIPAYVSQATVSGITYTTTAPTAANTSGLKICVLSSEPATKYDGWLYFITEN